MSPSLANYHPLAQGDFYTPHAWVLPCGRPRQGDPLCETRAIRRNKRHIGGPVILLPYTRSRKLRRPYWRIVILSHKGKQLGRLTCDIFSQFYLSPFFGFLPILQISFDFLYFGFILGLLILFSTCLWPLFFFYRNTFFEQTHLKKTTSTQFKFHEYFFRYKIQFKHPRYISETVRKTTSREEASCGKETVFDTGYLICTCVFHCGAERTLHLNGLLMARPLWGLLPPTIFLSFSF